MDKIYWNKLGFFGKVIFVLGWLNVLNLIFWVSLLIYHAVTGEKRFWTPGSYRVVYVFGVISFAALIAGLLLLLFLIPFFVVSSG